MGKNRAQEPDLGKTLIRARFPNRHRTKASETTLTTIEADPSSLLNPNSITEMRNLDEFLTTATLADTEFKAEKIASKTLIENIAIGKVLDRASQSALLAEYSLKADRLRIPRRPAWFRGQDAREIDKAEREAFLLWRRDLAIFEECESSKIGFTPFEKNIEIWRQLWRVVERSDLIVQIVDARNPLLFHCLDLDAYVSEVGKGHKKVLLLANKADLLTPKQRHTWKQYLESKGIAVMFYSATSIEPQDDLPSIEQVLEQMIEQCPINPLYTEGKASNIPQKCIGMVGYPNVGKSSTINALLGEKKVAVGITPGKTKHYQTLWINDYVMLCDCPGLVFPNFTSSKAELIANGILSIDQARDYVSPAGLVAQRIPRHILESTYGICIPKPREGELETRAPSGSELLSSYALMRGFRTGVFGAPDESRAARIILKDWVSGKLKWCEPPPMTLDYSAFNEYPPSEKALRQQLKVQRPVQERSSPFDEDYFCKGQKDQFVKWSPMLKGFGQGVEGKALTVKDLPKKRHFKGRK